MTDRSLSPAAKAILEAYDNSPWEYDTGDLTACAAVLRAAANQVVPKAEFYLGTCCERELKTVRADLLAIAAELETQ